MNKISLIKKPNLSDYFDTDKITRIKAKEIVR